MTFAGVSKLSGGGPLGAEMQAGFIESRVWEKMWGLPGQPFLYAIGVSELLAGPPILAATLGLAEGTPPLLCSAVVMAITACATASHLVRGDPPGAIGFCGTIFTMSVVFTFSYASTLSGKVKTM